jgi:hypothetical protein
MAMKAKLLFLLLIFTIFAVVVTARFFLLKNSVKQGQLKIITSPSATVLINNQSKGKTPFESTLDEGEYLIKLVPETTEASESASWSGKAKIFSNTLTYINRELGVDDISSSGVIFSVKKMDKKPTKKQTGEIEIITEPDGAIVSLDNEEQGIAPVVLSEIPVGDHELSTYSPGFFRRSQKIRIEDGYRVIAEFKLSIDPTHKKVEKKDPEEIRKEATESAQIEEKFSVTINTTETGWLRVRYEPTLNASEAAKVTPGKAFQVLEEKEGWYRIEYEKGKMGWVSSNYVTKATGTLPTPTITRGSAT